MYKVCSNCGRELPEEQFELYPSGTRRRVCRQCHYELHVKRAVQKWRRKDRARIFMNRRK